MENKINMKTDNMKYSKELIKEIEDLNSWFGTIIPTEEFEKKASWLWVSSTQHLKLLSNEFLETFKFFITRYKKKISWKICLCL